MSHTPRWLIFGRLARGLARSLDGSCQIVLADTSLERLSEGPWKGVTCILLPVPEALHTNPELASPALFDLVVAAEPMGYVDLSEYSSALRPFIRRRAKEDERKLDQVQLLCVERRERLEDARDELYSAGYYLADHDEARPQLRSAVLQAGHDVSLLALPSAEKEQRKAKEQREAQERKAQREAVEVAQAEQEEEEMVQKTVLQTTLFDPVLMTPEERVLPVAYEVGKPSAELLLVWLPGNTEAAETWSAAARAVEGESASGLRIMVTERPAGGWHSWSDKATVARGMEWYEMHDMPTDEAIAQAAKDPATNLSFGRPSVEELQCMQEIEVGCKQLFNLLQAEVAKHPKTKVILGGFSQGGATAAFATLSGAAPPEVQERLIALVPCCCAVPGFQFLASKMQAACLRRRDLPEESPFPSVHLMYCRNDLEVSDHYVQTILGLCNRFEHAAQLQSFEVNIQEQLPGGPRPVPGRPDVWWPRLVTQALKAASR